MTDSTPVDPRLDGPSPTTAGGLLRRARQAQGLHIAALAASIKVTPRKLEALEADQFDQLPDATFTRALAQTVCRSLKIDPIPVLALLPPPNGHRLEEVAEGLKTPFTERPGRLAPSGLLKLNGATLGVAGVLLLAAVVLYLMPATWVTLSGAPRGDAASSAETAAAPVELFPPGSEAAAASAALLPASAAAIVVDTEPAASAPGPASVATTAPAASAPAGALQFQTTEAAWIGVTDASGKSLMGRLVQPGETIDLDGNMPLTLRVGNANRVRVTFRGEAMDLAKFTRDNVARLQLK